jgi:hypothetical protein
MTPFCPNPDCGAEIDENLNRCPVCELDLNAQQLDEKPQYTLLPPKNPQPPTYTYKAKSFQKPRSNGIGTISVVLAIIGCFCFAYVFGPIAMILGGIGISKDDSPSKAKAGLVFGIIVLCFGIISLIFSIPFLIFSF